MADLIIQDTFDPYYAGRDEGAGVRSRPVPRAKKPSSEAYIVLPDDVPAYVPPVPRDRRFITH